MRGLTLGVATAVVLAGCSPAGPRDELVAAFERSFSGPFDYTLRVEAEDGADETEVGSLVRGLEVSGRHADGMDALIVRILGLDVFELRSEGPDRHHVRLGLGQLFRIAAGGDVDPSAAMVEVLETRGAPRHVLDIVRTGLDGGWLTVEGEIDTAELERILGGGPTPTASEGPGLRDALCDNLPGFVGCFVEVRAVSGTGAERIYEIELDVAEVVRRLGTLDPTVAGVDVDGLPERVPGTVTTRDGLVRAVEVHLPSAGGRLLEVAGGVRARLEIRDHGVSETVAAPERTTRVDAGEFLAALDALMDVTEEIRARP